MPSLRMLGFVPNLIVTNSQNTGWCPNLTTPLRAIYADVKVGDLVRLGAAVWLNSQRG